MKEFVTQIAIIVGIIILVANLVLPILYFAGVVPGILEAGTKR